MKSVKSVKNVRIRNVVCVVGLGCGKILCNGEPREHPRYAHDLCQREATPSVNLTIPTRIVKIRRKKESLASQVRKARLLRSG